MKAGKEERKNNAKIHLFGCLDKEEKRGWPWVNEFSLRKYLTGSGTFLEDFRDKVNKLYGM